MSERMNPVAKALWLTALRSGDYKQAQGVLKTFLDDINEVGYCCLGVLSEVAPDSCGAFKGYGNGQHYFKVVDADGYEYMESAVLPRPVGDWADIESQTAHVKIGTWIDESGIENHLWESLTELNDNHGFTFEQIADIVEYAL